MRLLNKEKLLTQLQNNCKNVRYNDFVVLIKTFGFKLIRIKGSHNIFERPDVPEMINIQNDKGNAKPYQIRQFLYLVEKYNLQMEG